MDLIDLMMLLAAGGKIMLTLFSWQVFISSYEINIESSCIIVLSAFMEQSCHQQCCARS